MTLRVGITEGHLGDGLKIFIVSRTGPHDQSFHTILRQTEHPGLTIWEPIEANADVPPTITLNDETGRALTDALVRHYQGAEDMRALRRDYDAALHRSDAKDTVIADVVRTLASKAGALLTPEAAEQLLGTLATTQATAASR